jgi:hypothetical protein
MTCFSYFSTLLGVTVYVHRWYDFKTQCACGDRHLRSEVMAQVVDR